MKNRHAVLYPMLDRAEWISRAAAPLEAVTRTVVSRWALLCAAACLSMSCGDSSDTQSSASTGGDGALTGGSTSTGGAGDAGGGGSPAGGSGGTTTISSTGGTVSPSGGVSSTTGGSSFGGTSAGGTESGGMPTGGRGPAGGRSGTAGSAPAGGVGSGGGSATGGITGTGGRGRGGSSSGGAATGGSESGGAATGGGSATGGSAAGGAGGATSSDATIVPDPDWACGMADGIPAPTQGQLAFSVAFQISATHDVGDTPYGHRRLLDVKGGTITGDKLKGSVVTGGLEYELTLSNGVVELQGINILKTSDNALIFVRSCGVAPDGSSIPRVIPDFEATTSGSYAWLNTGKFVATRTLDATGGTLQLDVYDVSQVTAGEPRVQITKPSGVPKQPWDCNKTTGTKGASVFTESVSLGSSMSISNAKYGSRNIIPITGGTTTGKVEGKILDGGADYQLSGSLDAWYTLAPSNGEFILVRNCGPMGKLIPWFEARTDGDYAFLNANTFLSSDPGMAGGGVSITFYERQ
jgi:hypothetical protein